MGVSRDTSGDDAAAFGAGSHAFRVGTSRAAAPAGEPMWLMGWDAAAASAALALREVDAAGDLRRLAKVALDSSTAALRTVKPAKPTIRQRDVIDCAQRDLEALQRALDAHATATAASATKGG